MVTTAQLQPPRDATIDYLPLRGTHRPQAGERI